MKTDTNKLNPTYEIRQNGKTVLRSDCEFSLPMIFNNLTGRNFAKKSEYHDYIRFIAIKEMAGLYRRDHRQHIERRPGHCKAGLYAVARRDAPKRPVHVLHRPVERHLQPTRPAHIITGCRGGSEMESQIHGGLGVYRRRVRSGRGLPERKGCRIEREFR